MAGFKRLRENYGDALATILQAAAVPYGVTLTVWGSGELVTHFRGAPHVHEVFLFALGGVTAYMVATLPATRAVREQGHPSPSPQVAFRGMLHVLSIGIALASVALVGMIDSWVAWPLGGLCGIGFYLTLVGVEYAVASALTGPPTVRRDSRGSPSSS